MDTPDKSQKQKSNQMVVAAGLILFLLVVIGALIWGMMRRSQDTGFQMDLKEVPEVSQDFASPATESGLGMQAAVTAFHQGNFESAARQFEELLRAQPDDAELHGKLGEALAAMNQDEKAISHLAEACRLNPRDTGSLLNLGISLGKLNRSSEAEQKFAEVVEKDAESSEAHYHLGSIRARLHRPEEAVGPLRKAIELNPAHPAALNELAWIMATSPQDKLRNGAEAVKLAERAVQNTENKKAQAMDTLAAAYAEEGRFDDAVSTAQKAQETARKMGDFKVVEEMKKREELYWQGKAYRDTATVSP